ncbi:MAG: nucleotidyltransferase domain-containing protein [Nanoarchaeota archaeon]|nr:nucleotidyltransferase domain-containing protein [Nanoarchaeota archaeon]
METQIKKAIKAGNSSAVILPRAWLNKNVKVELIKKSNQEILLETLTMIQNFINPSEIIGIYLTGSYARNEEELDSDIDILIITEDKDKPQIQQGIYNILIISEKLLNQKLKSDLFPIAQMIREAKPLINKKYLDSIKIQPTKKNTKWYIDTTKQKINLINKIIQKKPPQIPPQITYTLILRLRTLYIIQQIIQNKPYSKKQFITQTKKITNSSDPYEAYLSVKNNQKSKNNSKITKEQIIKLNNHLKQQLDKVRKMIKKT